jgi:hypothetical protein
LSPGFKQILPSLLVVAFDTLCELAKGSDAHGDAEPIQESTAKCGAIGRVEMRAGDLPTLRKMLGPFVKQRRKRAAANAAGS